MGEDAYFLDTVLLLAGLALILLITFRATRRPSSRRPVEGQRMAMYGLLVWLGLFGLALYLIFG